jgi:4-aminobutyrate aminotransferase-like enzyme
MKQLIIESVKRGLLVISCGESTIRIAPSLAIPEELVDKGLDILDVALNTVERSL